MKRIILPGTGNPITLTPAEDSVVTVMAAGRFIDVKLTAGIATRIEFLQGTNSVPLAA